MKVTINTSSFAKFDKAPVSFLEAEGIAYQLNPYKRTLTESEIISFSREADGVIAGLEPLTKDVLERMPNLKVISRCGVGINNVDAEYAKNRNISVFNTPDGPTIAVAELTVSLILNCIRHVAIMDREMRQGQWNKRMGNLLHGKKIGIIGYGRIGQKVASLLLPFGVEIAVSDIKKISLSNDIKEMSFSEIIEWSDILCLHVSSSDSGQPLITKKEFDLIKKGAWLINLSRGGVVDEEALYEALKSKHLAGAAVDVYQEEPYSGKLKELDNILLTPHIGSYAIESRVDMEMQAVNNLINGLKKWSQK